MSAQSQINSLIGKTTAGIAAVSHILSQDKMTKELKEIKGNTSKGVDSKMAAIASDKWRQKAQAMAEQRARIVKRMAGGVLNDDSRQKSIKAREALEKKASTSFNTGMPKRPDEKGGK